MWRCAPVRGTLPAGQLTGMKLGALNDALCPDRADKEPAEENDDAKDIERERDSAPGNVRRLGRNDVCRREIRRRRCLGLASGRDEGGVLDRR